MTFKSPEPQIGISGYWPELAGKVDFFELDAAEALSLSMIRKIRKLRTPVVISAGHFFLREVRLTELSEICESTEALTCVLKLPPSYWLWEDAEKSLKDFSVQWREQAHCPLAVDPGRAGIPDFSKTDAFEWIADPLWLPANSRSSSVWRIHGWHEGRWVRRYSEVQLRRLALSIQNERPRLVALCHSQRAAQVGELFRHLPQRPSLLN